MAHLHLEQIDGLIAAAGVDGAREILDAFRRSTCELLETLATQIKQGALDLAGKTAHAIKGSAANVGAQRLAETATGVEEACRRGDKADAARRLNVAQENFEMFRASFNDHLSKG